MGATSVTGATQINTSGTAATTLGHAGNTSAVNLVSGGSAVSVNNQAVSLVAGASLATNGNTGTTGAVGAGGFTSYSSAQPALVNGQSVANALTGATYVNKVNGNTLVDGNLYVNGVLQFVSSQSATTTVTDGSAAAGSALVKSGGAGLVVDDNGKLSGGTTSQATASLTVTNDQGNVHGVLVQESQTTVSGGANSTSLMLNDNGARFSNSATGEPVTVTGVADGKSSFDAVNVRQFAGAVAAVAATANLPATDPGKTGSVGVAIGSYMGKSALALGAQYRVLPGATVKFSVASGLNKGGAKPVVGAGANWSW